MIHTCVKLFVPLLIILSITNLCYSASSSIKTSIVFATLGKLSYNFDIYTLPINPTPSPPFFAKNYDEVKITDGTSVNFNGHFVANSSPIFSRFNSRIPRQPSIDVVYVTDRNGTTNINFDSVNVDSLSRTTRIDSVEVDSLSRPGSRSALEVSTRVQVPLLKEGISMKDRPSLVGERLVYVSTHENSGVPRTSWAAVYSTHLLTGSTRRLTPKGIADFSPAVSPSGVWTAVASYGEEGWGGEIDELGTDIYVFKTRDGSSRVKVVEHGGWPCWVDDHTIYFHRRDPGDGWWSVYKANLPRVGRVRSELVKVQRVTPPGLHAFTPAASPGNYEFIVVATRRAGSDYRHIELFDLVTKKFKEVTRPITPLAHHLNPFISADSTRVGYHKCRGGSNGKQILLEYVDNPKNEFSLFRVAGSFPSFSPTGDQIAYVDLDDGYINVVNIDGSNRRTVFKGRVFTTAWNPVRKGVIYTSLGPTFASERTKVDIISITMDDNEISYKKLTYGGENNAFPSPSPDGKWIVFRSGRTGYKNLYIMDAEEGETGSLERLTEGPWDDTMANWSPDGEWIAFASDRENPGSGSFEIFMIHPNGTGLRKVIQSGSGGRANHPWFSPDGKSIVFTSDYAGVSAEPISNPHHFQPYGEIFIAKIDGSDIQRMTYNSYEDGTPTWGPTYMSPENVVKSADGPRCAFEDCHWLNINPKGPKYGCLKTEKSIPCNISVGGKC
ncbi:uncharacterized protein LOC141606172 [Silene latifolia]|uniref:uncharacterized protein LOC141606172 n=1 Tax=Silene latifolia TaxID=37657 RepID=UPI003D7771C5